MANPNVVPSITAAAGSATPIISMDAGVEPSRPSQWEDPQHEGKTEVDGMSLIWRL